MNKSDNQHSHHHDPQTKDDVVKRLKRIEGQVRGIMNMVKEDVYCHDILNLFASVKSALNGARDVVLREHIQNCIAEEMKQDKQKATEELINIFKKVSK